MESTVRPVLADLLRGDPLTAERKGVLAQFLGLQMVRGPAFFEQHSQHIDALVAGLDASRFRAIALREAEGDLAVARERLRGLYSDKTRQLVTMISTSYKLSSVIGCMRWRLLRFDATLLAYSDHPVVVWPLEVDATDGFSEPNLDPMNAIEVSVALSPRLALLMTWANAPDDDFGVSADLADAGQLNALTIAQADRQWMHQLGDEPPVAQGPLAPLSHHYEPGYSASTAQTSPRRAAAARFLQRVRNKRFLSSIDYVYIAP